MTSAELIAGGNFASAVIGKLVEVVRSYLGDNYDLLTNLENELPLIQILIEAAEKQQITNRGLGIWLDELKNAAYEAEDVLDGFEAKRIRYSIKGKGKVIASSPGKMVKSMFFPDKDLKKFKSVVNKLEKLCMGDAIKILQLTHIDKREEHLYSLGSETCSYLAPGVAIFGRDREIALILDMVLNVVDGDFYNLQQRGEGSSRFWDGMNNFLGWIVPRKPLFIQTVKKGDAPEQSKSRLTRMKSVLAEPHSISNRGLAVIPIVGIGGVGKTAVAKSIFNDARVREHFALRAWVYVSENCDTKNIMQAILFSFESGIMNPLMKLDIVAKKLVETIRNQRFLVILDDLSDITKHIWSMLVSVLCNGEVGSVVVVTTQNRSIANTIRTLPEVTLDVLPPESFWELFQYYAFRGSNHEELKDIGKQIAERLYGLPLAGEAIGTILSTRLEREHWKDILGCDWWNIEYARKKILSSIAVGYNYFDPQLKQCFVFCSIFPKNYVFEREKLVQMWIALGFVQPSKEETGRQERENIRLEDIGREWFGKLVDQFFFQPTLGDGKYLMHDLARDLAVAVSSKEFCFVESHDKNVPSVARHVGINCDNIEVEWKCKDNMRLRTMILFVKWKNCSAKSISKIFAKHNGLRVLDLSYIVLGTNTLIDAACQLSHLRFLDLSFTGIESIPDEFCALCHLQVLDVRGCNFKRLPKGMNKLINLRHLYASSDTISLIYKIGKLTKLQEIKELRIGKHKGHGISELMDMNEIGGHLLLSNLNNVSNKEEATEAKLNAKTYLKSLELRFDYNDNRGPTTVVQMEILDALKPAPGLEILKVEGCRGTSVPGWMSSHPVCNNLKDIHVSSFGLSSLPAFGKLPHLETLSFVDLPSINNVGSEFYGDSDNVFPSLKELTFSRMSSWREWSDVDGGRTAFPHLKKLHMEKCCVLQELPTNSFTSTVVELKLSQCHDLNIETLLQRLPSLAHLSIKTEVNNTLYICCTPSNSLEDLHLEVMYPEDMIELIFVGGLKSLVNLRKLVIIGFDEILESYKVAQKNEEQCLQSLTYLHLCHGRHFYSTHSLPRVGRLSSLRTLLIEYSPVENYTRDEESWFPQLTSLENLEFRNCIMLRCLPSTLQLLTTLKKLQIYNCPCVISLPENSLPQNLEELHINECPNLISQFQPNQGADQHIISHIQSIHLDGEMIPIQGRSPSHFNLSKELQEVIPAELISTVDF